MESLDLKAFHPPIESGKDPQFDDVDRLVELVQNSFTALQSMVRLDCHAVINTKDGPFSVSTAHNEIIEEGHEPCCWCLKYRPQDLTAHEHISIIDACKHLPRIAGESYPDTIITTPVGNIYAWDGFITRDRAAQDYRQITSWVLNSLDAYRYEIRSAQTRIIHDRVKSRLTPSQSTTWKLILDRIAESKRKYPPGFRQVVLEITTLAQSGDTDAVSSLLHKYLYETMLDMSS